MLLKFNQQLILQLIFENTKFLNFFFLKNNYNITLIFLQNFYFCKVLKKNFFFFFTQLIDTSIIPFVTRKIFFKKNLIFFNFFNFFLKKYFFFLFFTKKITSITSLYKCSVWLEREIRELYNFKINKLNDNRNLLLNYNTQYYPFLKNFPTEGVEEVYFNFKKKKLKFFKLSHVEL